MTERTKSGSASCAEQHVRRNVSGETELRVHGGQSIEERAKSECGKMFGAVAYSFSFSMRPMLMAREKILTLVGVILHP